MNGGAFLWSVLKRIGCVRFSFFDVIKNLGNLSESGQETLDVSMPDEDVVQVENDTVFASDVEYDDRQKNTFCCVVLLQKVFLYYQSSPSS